MISNKLILILLVLIFSGSLGAQKVEIDQLIAAEKEMGSLLMQISEIRFNDYVLDSLNSKLENMLGQVLLGEASFHYPFDSLKAISKLKSKDALVRIFTWNTVNANGNHQLSGFIQYFHKSQNKILLYKLSDQSNRILEPEKQTLNPNKWFGATYYDIIESKINSGTVYLLLGWDGNNLSSNKKVIEPLLFDSNGNPIFGSPIFKAGNVTSHRIVFEYSRMTSMLLRYDHDLKMIIFDHLAPTNAIYQGNFMFYGPDFSYDAFEFYDDLWHFKPVIDYKKPKEKKKFRKS